VLPISVLLASPRGGEREGTSPVVPVLAIEIPSPLAAPEQATEDADTFLAASVTIVWFIDPVEKTAVVHDTDGSPRRLAIDDSPNGGTLLPEIEMSIADLFR
jgi:Uma2 family endonuclease